MKTQERGRIFLEAASKEKVRQKVLAYLCRLFKKIPREEITDLLRKTPVVLIDNLPASKAKTILADLERLGAIARFLPNSESIIKPGNSSTAILSQGTPSSKAGPSAPSPIIFPSSRTGSKIFWVLR